MKVCLLGCGVAVEHQIPAIRGFPGARIAGICDLNEARLKEFGERWGIPNRYADFGEMLQRERPDVVHVMTPPGTHASLAVQAMESGSHVLVEKPMATSEEDAERMIQAAARREVKLCVMHNHLFDPQILKAGSMLEQGSLGDILHVAVNYSLDRRKMVQEGLIRPDHWAHRLPIGIFGEYLPHLTYLALAFMPRIETVQASRNGEGGYEVGRVNGISVQLKGGGATGHLMMLDHMAYGHFSLHLYGTRCVVHINMLDLTTTVEKERGLPRPAAWMLSTVEQGCLSILATFRNAAKIATGRLRRRPGHKLLIERFYDSIRRDMPSPVTGEEGMAVVRTLDMIRNHILEPGGG
jgi:predicted dehydrogenase